jgi:polar amino acid transport system substrate-binding protein
VKRLLVLLAVMLLSSLMVLPALANDHSSDQPLTALVDMGEVPAAFLSPAGQPEGLVVDITAALAKRLGRPGYKIVDVDWSGIFAALNAKKGEFIAATTNITPDRVKVLDFTEPWMNTAQAMAINVKNKGVITGLDSLKGRTIATNTGSVSDDWLVAHQKEYGYKIDRYNHTLDALMAVQTGRDDAVIGDVSTIAYAVKDKSTMTLAFTIPTGEQYGFVCRKGDPFRNQLEAALEGLKLDGTLAAIYKKWFGVDPEPYSPVTTVYAGYGVPGMDGFQMIYHQPLFAPPTGN